MINNNSYQIYGILLYSISNAPIQTISIKLFCDMLKCNMKDLGICKITKLTSLHKKAVSESKRIV